MADAAERELLDRVRDVFSAIAERPRERHPIPAGRALAEALGYPRDALDVLPPSAVEAFAGVSDLAWRVDLPPGALAVDVGSGAGMDALLVAQRLEASGGRVIGVDFSPAMLRRARAAAALARIENVEFREASATSLPLPDAAADLVLVNGILNLNPGASRRAVAAECRRVLKENGVAYFAELIRTAPRTDATRERPADWFA